MSNVPSQAGRPGEAGIQLHLGKGELYRLVEEVLSPNSSTGKEERGRTEMTATWPEVIIDKVR